MRIVKDYLFSRVPISKLTDHTVFFELLSSMRHLGFIDQYENNWNIERRIAPFLSLKVYMLKSKRSKVKRIKTHNVLRGDKIDCKIALKYHLDDI